MENYEYHMPKEIAELLKLPTERATDWVTVDFTPVEKEFFRTLQEIMDSTSVLLSLSQTSEGQIPTSFTRVLHILCSAWFSLGVHTNTFGFPEGFEDSVYDLLDKLDKIKGEENDKTNE